MKFVVNDLRIGEIVQAKVAEVLGDNQVIISLRGDLLRAENETGRTLYVDDVVVMRVIGTSPLQLRITDSERRFGRLDVIG